MQETVNAIESAREGVDFVNKYVQRHLCGAKQAKQKVRTRNKRLRRKRQKFRLPSAKK